MSNDDVAETLEQYGRLLEISGESAFRVRAYSRAADAIRHLHQPLTELAAGNQLTSIEGVGAGIAAAIEEILTTGVYAPFEGLKEAIPVGLLDIVEIPGVGIKTVGKLYTDLGITNLGDLETALDAGTIAAQKGFGPKTAERIVAGLAQLRRRTGRLRLGTARPLAEGIVVALKASLPNADVSVAGSVRRMEETVGDIDFVLAHDNLGEARSAVESLAQVAEVIESGSEDHIRVRIVGRTEADFYLTDKSDFGSALVIATGSEPHVNELSFPEPAASEADLYAANDLPWIPPELRQGIDEFDLAKSGQMNKLVTVADMNGEFHSHTTWSDGVCSVADMAAAAQGCGYTFLGISDHSKSLGVANGLDPERIKAQRGEIDHVQVESGFKLFASCEVEVDRGGNLDFDDAVLASLDIVIASTHSGLRQTREQLTERLTKVLQNPHVDIIAHPTGRLLEQREGGDFDWDVLLPLAAKTGTALEINSDPARLDFGAEMARRALAAGCLITINCDAHHPDSFANIVYGISVARRAGATPDQILNCWPLAKIEGWLTDRSQR
jgi:DNA polymerase (family 10)